MKKTLFSIFLVMLMSLTFAQNQISELQKGLIFHAPLSEWYPATDLVSGTVGTATATYNVLDRQGSGRRYIDNVNAGYASLADAAAYDFGTSDFTLIASFTPANITDNGKYIISKEAGGIGYGLYQQGNDLYVRIDDNTTDASGIIGTDILVAGTKITCEVVFNRAGNAVLYLNSSASSSGTLAISTASLTLDNTGAFVVGNVEAHNAGFTGQIHFVRAFNFALTTQIANYSKPSYPIEATHRGAGATKNVLDLNAEGLTAAGHWYDRTNSSAPTYTSVDATVSGAVMVIPPASNLSAAAFNGTTSNIAFTGMDGLTGDITVSCWINVNATPAISGHILNNGKLYLELGNDLKIRVYRDGSTAAASGSALSINTDYNVVITSTSTGYTNIYFNNAISNATYNSGTPSSGTVALNIGGGTYKFAGKISDIPIWNRILDQDQIRLLYDLGR